MLPDEIFYNYVYLNPTKPGRYQTETVSFLFEPLYIGKGKGNRFQHGIRAINESKSILTNKLLYVALVRLLRNGFEPAVTVFNDCCSNDKVLEIEDGLIKHFGRRGIEDFGVLCNRALGGEIPDTTGLPSAIKGKKMKDFFSEEAYKKYIEKISIKSEAQILKMVQTRRLRGSYNGGPAHGRAKIYTITSPAGEEFIVNGSLKKILCLK
jgi:hypothetical protein